VPRGKKYQRHAGGLIEIEGVGNWNNVYRRNSDQFAIASVNPIAKDGEFAALVLQAGGTLCTAIAKMHGREQDALAGFQS